MMLGSFISVWQYSWNEVWGPLDSDPHSPNELFMELYPELAKALEQRPEQFVVLSSDQHIVRSLRDAEFADASTNSEAARRSFQSPPTQLIISERKLCRFLEEAHDVIEDFGEELAAKYIELVRTFIQRYNLRYTLGSPFLISPSIPGLISTFVDELERQAMTSGHQQELRRQFVRAIDVMTQEGRAEDVPRCIGAACNLVEGFARGFPGATSQTLGELAKELQVWPHATMKEALLKLYGFCSDYPSIRHSGNPSGQLRALTAKDGLLVSTLLLIFSGYFMQLDMDEIMCVTGGGSQ